MPAVPNSRQSPEQRPASFRNPQFYAEQRRDLLEIVDDRCDRGLLLITSQIPVASWHDVVGDPTLGDANLDRVLHTAHRIKLKGDSLRWKASIRVA